jgi:transcriptional regulator with XRE-family HTH domain
MNQVGDAFAAALKQMLKERKLTVVAAAARLGVSRQTFHSYLNGVLPRRKTLSKAVHVWDLKLDLGHHSFGRESFDREQSKGRPPVPEQPTLWEALDSLTDEDVQISLKRVGKAFGVHLKIKIPA